MVSIGARQTTNASDSRQKRWGDNGLKYVAISIGKRLEIDKKRSSKNSSFSNTLLYVYVAFPLSLSSILSIYVYGI